MPNLPPTVPKKPCGCRSRKPDPRPSAAARGYDANHRRLRLIVLKEQPICAICKTAFSTEMDHIDGNVNNLERSNLQGLCKSCHSKKTASQRSN